MTESTKLQNSGSLVVNCLIPKSQDYKTYNRIVNLEQMGLTGGLTEPPQSSGWIIMAGSDIVHLRINSQMDDITFATDVKIVAV